MFQTPDIWAMTPLHTIFHKIGGAVVSSTATVSLAYYAFNSTSNLSITQAQGVIGNDTGYTDSKHNNEPWHPDS